MDTEEFETAPPNRSTQARPNILQEIPERLNNELYNEQTTTQTEDFTTSDPCVTGHDKLSFLLLSNPTLSTRTKTVYIAHNTS